MQQSFKHKEQSMNIESTSINKPSTNRCGQKIWKRWGAPPIPGDRVNPVRLHNINKIHAWQDQLRGRLREEREHVRRPSTRLQHASGAFGPGADILDPRAPPGLVSKCAPPQPAPAVDTAWFFTWIFGYCFGSTFSRFKFPYGIPFRSVSRHCSVTFSPMDLA